MVAITLSKTKNHCSSTPPEYFYFKTKRF